MSKNLIGLDEKIIATTDTSRYDLYTCPTHGIYTVSKGISGAISRVPTKCPYYKCDKQGVKYDG